MKNILLSFLIILAFGLVSLAHAYDLTLTKIGTLSTIGADYSLVSYTGSIPGLEGTATPAATVAVKVNTTTTNVIAATSSGVWNFTPTSLNSGDNTIVITSGTQSLNFVIRYSATTTTTVVSTASAEVTELPESGVWENIFFGAIVGLAVFGLGGWVKRKMHIWENGR